MIDPHTSDARQREDHQTVIKFVLSGPILGGHEAEVAQIIPPSAEIDELRERMTSLERALADADARIDALSRALATTVSSMAATPGNWSSRRTERAARAPEPSPQPQSEPPAPEPVALAAVEPEPEPVAPAPDPIAYEPEPVAAAPEPVAYEPAPVAPAPEPIAYEPEPRGPAPEPIAYQPAPIAPAPIAYAPQPVARMHEPEPVYAMAVAAKPELAPLALVAQPATRVPALRSSHPTPPKVRALRRVISVLKHL